MDGVHLAAGRAPSVGDIVQRRQIMSLDAMARLVAAQRARIIHDAVHAADVEAEELAAEFTMLPP